MHTALLNTVGRFKTSQFRPISARISWKEGEKTVTGYSVQVEGPDSTQVIPTQNTYVEISNLRPSTQYYFKVSAVTVASTTPQRGKTSVPYDHYQCTCITILGCPSMSIYSAMFMQYTHLCIAHYIHTNLESDPLSESFDTVPYYWKYIFTPTSGKDTAQYRMMLEYAPSLEDALADDTKIIWLATELDKAGLITEDQRKSLETSIIDSGTRAAKLISMITSKVCSNSENFTTFRDVLRKDDTTYGHVLANIKDKGMIIL